MSSMTKNKSELWLVYIIAHIYDQQISPEGNKFNNKYVYTYQGWGNNI